MDYITLLISLPVFIELMVFVSLLAVFAFKWKPDEVSDDLPLVTVFLPYYNEDKNHILTSLKKIDEQEYPSRIQVLIINDGSTNTTPSYVGEWVRKERNHEYILVDRNENTGRKGAALDFALEKNIAVGEIYIVVDSDTFIEPGGILALSNKIWSHPEYAAVCGYVVPSNRTSNLLCRSQFYEHIGVHGAIRTSQDQLGLVPVLAGAFVAHRASVVKELGGWSEWLVEDISWCWKAIAHRYRTGYTAQAIATTHCPENKMALFRQRRRWSRGRVEAFAETWKVSPLMGFISLPWFLMSATEFLFPPLFVAMPLFAILGLWLPFYLMCAALTFETVFILFFIRRTGNTHNLNPLELACLPIFTHLLRFITWVPNILGYLDEIMKKEKKWLTR